MKPTKTYTVKEALVAISKYCVYQDRCHQEVEQKLIKMQMIPEARAVIIADLIKMNFLNEERFALNYARGKFNQKGWGRIKIRQELKRRKISDYLLKKALEQIDNEAYFSKLNNLAEKKFNLYNKDTSYKTQAKIKNHLIYKGYEIHLILEVLNNLGKL